MDQKLAYRPQNPAWANIFTKLDQEVYRIISSPEAEAIISNPKTLQRLATDRKARTSWLRDIGMYFGRSALRNWRKKELNENYNVVTKFYQKIMFQALQATYQNYLAELPFGVEKLSWERYYKKNMPPVGHRNFFSMCRKLLKNAGVELPPSTPPDPPMYVNRPEESLKGAFEHVAKLAQEKINRLLDEKYMVSMHQPIIAWVHQNCKFAWTKPRKFDIFTADLSVGSQTKERPALVLSIDKDMALVAPMSSSWEYQKAGDFVVNKAHPDFSRTKLNDSGFIKGWSMYIPLRDLHTKIGELSGKLLTQYLRSSRPQPVNQSPSIQRETPISRTQVPDEAKQVQEIK